MTYWEKWRVDIENIGVQFNGKKTEDINQAATIIAVGKDGTPRMCRRDCADCIFKSSIGDISCVWKARKWLGSEAEPEKKMMTNKEKNEKRFDELGLGDSSDFIIAHRIAVRKSGDVDLCALTPCHDCIFRCGSCIKEAEEWLTDEAEPDEPTPEKEEEKVKKEVKKEELKVGDTVKARTTRMREGKIGTVKSIVQRRNGSKIYSVQLNGNGYGSTFLEYEIEKVKPKKTPPRIVV